MPPRTSVRMQIGHETTCVVIWTQKVAKKSLTPWDKIGRDGDDCDPRGTPPAQATNFGAKPKSKPRSWAEHIISEDDYMGSNDANGEQTGSGLWFDQQPNPPDREPAQPSFPRTFVNAPQPPAADPPASSGDNTVFDLLATIQQEADQMRRDNNARKKEAEVALAEVQRDTAVQITALSDGLALL